MRHDDFERPYLEAIDDIGISQATGALLAEYVGYVRPDVTIDGLPMASGRFDKMLPAIKEPEDMGSLYECGLAHASKESKKQLGQYYTPSDVSCFMARLLYECCSSGEYLEDAMLVDPCCGSGNLTHAFIKELPRRDRWDFLTRHVIICDVDEMALDIASAMLICAYAPQGIRTNLTVVRRHLGDFLLAKPMHLAHEYAHTIAIVNPPYGRTHDSAYASYKAYPSKELYALFLERLSDVTDITVAVTPQSFLGGRKFTALRQVLAESHDASVYAYDNMPASLFCGRKHGVFNSNTSNSVRAAITVMSKHQETDSAPHVRTPPLMRWKAEERPKLFEASRSLMSAAQPIADVNAVTGFPKIPVPLAETFDILGRSSRHLSDLLASEEPEWALDVPMTPRYFTSASSRPLDRAAKHVLHFPDEKSMAMAYLTINSSLAYGWWRAYDGGITITATLLRTIPVPDGIDADSAVSQMRKIRENEGECIVTKLNAGRVNENLKLPAATLVENLRILMPNLPEKERKAFAAFHASDLGTQIDAWA